MSKATHNGTCQCCGRKQALPGDVLSKHGYTVEHGFFEGVCPGQSHLPLEQDRTLADKIAADLLAQSKALYAKVDAIEAGSIRPQYANYDGGHHYTKNREGRTETIVVLYADAEAWDQQEAVNRFAMITKNRADLADSLSRDITKRAKRVHGLPLEPRVAEVKKVIAVGTRIRLWGSDVVVTGVDYKVAQGCGPHLNGKSVPHFSFINAHGSTRWYPCQKIRQAAID